MSILDRFSLSVTGSASFNHLLRWRQLTGNGVLVRFPVRWTVFLTDLHCLMFAKSIPTILHHGGSKREIVFRDGSWCGGCVFSVDFDCLTVTRSILDVGHTGDKSGRPPVNVLKHLFEHSCHDLLSC